MDLIIDPLDEHVLNHVYPAWLPADDWRRQSVTSFFFLWFGGAVVYFLVATMSYYTVFDHRLRKHPRFLPNQERVEIAYAMRAMPWMALYTVPLVVLELRGHAKLFDDWSQRTPAQHAAAVFLFFVWNDFAVYIVHRALHTKWLYKVVHKTHHEFHVTTPYSALAFEPLDGWSQSVPIHAFIFAVPFHKKLYLASFIFIQFWTIAIHDEYFILREPWNKVFLTSAHHAHHHLRFTGNHGLYTTFMDRLGGTYVAPDYEPVTSLADVLAKQKLGITETEPVMEDPNLGGGEVGGEAKKQR